MRPEASRTGIGAESLGESLRREREMRGISLEEISTATKIGVRMLEAIERQEFSKLPTGIYGRSFIRSYARYLGLSDEPLLAEYDQVAPGRGDTDLSQLMQMTRPQPIRRRSGHGAIWAILSAAVLLGAGVVLYRSSRIKFLEPANAPAASQAPPAQTGATSSSPSSAAPNAAGPNGIPVAGAATTLGGSQPTILGTGTALTLQVAATERAWVTVKSDGKLVFQGLLEPNDVKTIGANESFDVMTGNAQGIILTLDGQTLQPLGGEGEVKSIHLTAANLKTP